MVITDQVAQGLASGGHGSVSIEERPVGRLAATLPILSSTLSDVVASTV